MQETRPWTATSRALARWSTVVIVALLVAACSNPPAASPSAARSRRPPHPRPPPPRPRPHPQPPNKYKIGYMSLGESVPFVKLVSHGIKEAADAAGQELLFCDSNIDAAEGPRVRAELKVQGAEGVINFQVNQDSRPRSAPPMATCRPSRSTSSSRPARSPSWAPTTTRPDASAAPRSGKYAKENWDCDYTPTCRSSRSAPGPPTPPAWAACATASRSTARSSTRRSSLDGATGRTRPSSSMTKLLPRCRATGSSSSRINEDGILGAIGAANTLGRETDLYYAGQGADQSIWKDIACNPQVHRLGGLLPGALRQDRSSRR